MINSNRHLVFLLGATFLVAVSACGRSGVSMPGSGSDASVTAGGADGGQSDGSQGGTTDSTSNQGGATSSAASGGQGGSNSSSGLGGTMASTGNLTSTASAGGYNLGGFTMNPGSVTSFGGMAGGDGNQGGWGGTGIAGGAQSSGGSSGGQIATIVKPREPQVHRPQALSCVGVFAPPEPVSAQSSICKKHADCTQSKGGYCVLPIAGYGRAMNSTYCVYEGCTADADCDAGKVCHCSPNDVPRCLYAGNCRSDADCGANGYCSPANGYDCAGIARSTSGYYCHTPKDTCIDDSDCSGKDYCDYDAVDGRWECKSVNVTCAIG